MMKKNKIALLLEIFFLLILIFFFELGNKGSLLFGKFLFFVSIFSNIQLLIKYRRKDILVIFLLFSFLHIIYIYPYFFLDIPYHYITKLQSYENTNFVFVVQIIVLRLIFFNINPGTFKPIRSFIKIHYNPIVYFVFVFLLILLIPISTRNLSSLSVSEGNYSIETKSSIWFEYSIVFITIASIYADTRIRRIIIYILAGIYMILPLMYGKRLAFLMVSLTVFNLFLTGKIKTKYIFFCFVIGFVFLRIFAQIRATGFVDLNIKSVLLGGLDKEVLSVGPGGVLVCSVTYYSLVKQEVFDLYFSFKSFFGMFTSIFIPSAMNFKETYINFEALKYENIPGNGGFPGVYFYIWGRYIGVFFGGLFLNYSIRNSSKGGVYTIYALFLLSTFPRWYTYNIHILIKMGFWLLLFYQLSKKTKTVRK